MRARFHLVSLTVLAAAVVVVGVADAKRPARPAEKASVVAALPASAIGPSCSASVFISTVDRRYAFASSGCPYEDSPNYVLKRSGSSWSVVVDGFPFYCSGRNAPPAVVRDLYGRYCTKTSASSSFATPSNNIACAYVSGPDVFDPISLECYVRSLRTLIIVPFSHYDTTTVKRGVPAPAYLKRVSSPVLLAGETWSPPADSNYACALRAGKLTCKNRGWGYGFVASGAGVKAIAPLPTHGPS